MLVNFIALNFIDFTTDEGNHIKGVNAWYLSSPQNNERWCGTRPLKKFFDESYIPLLSSSGCGKYDISTDLSGRVDSIKFIGK